MPPRANYFNFPFDPIVFNLMWQSSPDPVLTTLLNSGVMTNDSRIAAMIAPGGDTFTIPFYNLLGGEPDNYRLGDNITVDQINGDQQWGIVYGRAHGWRASGFNVDYNQGANPMAEIARQVSFFWQKQRQRILLAILNGVFNSHLTGNAAAEFLDTHVVDLSTSTATVGVANVFGPATGSQAMQIASGDFANGLYQVMVCHSRVAANLAQMQLLNPHNANFQQTTNASQMLSPGTYNGITVLIDDGVPVYKDANNNLQYVTYVFGRGALSYAPGRLVGNPASEMWRDPATNGGEDYLYTRIRECIHPNGFRFNKPAGYSGSPTNAQLGEVAAELWYPNNQMITGTKTPPMPPSSPPYDSGKVNDPTKPYPNPSTQPPVAAPAATTNWEICSIPPKVLPLMKIITNG